MLLLLLVVIIKTLVCCLATDCPDGWLAYEGSCYFFGSDDVHYTEAEHYCQNHNAHLAHVGSSEENSFLKSYIASFHGTNNYWMGLTDEIAEGIWRWTNDEGLEYSDWGGNDPDNYLGTQDCVVFYHNFQYKWGDIQCTSNNRALCEKRIEDTPGVVG